METGTLEKKIANLPDELKLKVEGYVDALTGVEVQIAAPVLIDNPKPSRSPKPVYGSGGGLIAFMADDFDVPLKEFHDYMYNVSVEFINKIEKLPLSMQQELEEIVNKMAVEAEKSSS